MRRIVWMLIVFCIAGVGLWLIQSPAQAAKPTDTPTPEPGTVAPTPTTQATPTPWVIMLITPTPEYRPQPPSLTITDLDKKIKKVYSPVRLSPLPESSIPVEIDRAINTFMPWLIAQEETYRSITGRFVQMMPSHVAAIPGDGQQLLPDGWYARPSDQQYSWDDLNAIRYEELPFAIHVDVYQGMEGPGFVTCFQVSELQRCINYGPEALRNQPWGMIQQ